MDTAHMLSWLREKTKNKKTKNPSDLTKLGDDLYIAMVRVADNSPVEGASRRRSVSTTHAGFYIAKEFRSLLFFFSLEQKCNFVFGFEKTNNVGTCYL